MDNKACNACEYYQYENNKYLCENDKSEKFNTNTAPSENCGFFSKQNAHSMEDLKYYQSLPLSLKIQLTRRRIRDWVSEFGEDGVYVSFSGGKDSTVLLDIVRKDYPDVEAVFVNTGLEYPSVRQLALSKENVTELRPTMNFRDVIIKYGYPIISKEVSECVYQARKGLESDNGYYSYRLAKLQGTALDKEGRKSLYNQEQWGFLLNAPFSMSHMCCNVMKKKPVKSFAKKENKKPIIGTMADESRLRTQQWIKNGCNGFDMKSPVSNPMSFWTEQDVLTYIHTTLPLQTHTAKWL